MRVGPDHEQQWREPEELESLRRVAQRLALLGLDAESLEPIERQLPAAFPTVKAIVEQGQQQWKADVRGQLWAEAPAGAERDAHEQRYRARRDEARVIAAGPPHDRRDEPQAEQRFDQQQARRAE